MPASLALVLILAACAATGGPPSGSSSSSPTPRPEGRIDHPTGVEPVLVIEETGGFAMVGMLATRLPTFVMLGDGRVIMGGMQTLEFPGPALPPLIERTLTEEGVQQVLEAVESTNLFTADTDLRGASSMVADATDTVFRLDAGGRQVTVSVYGLGLLDPSMGTPEGITAGELQAHATLSSLRDALLALDATIGAEGWETEGWQPYEPVAFRLYVRDVTDDPVEGDDLPGQVGAWPTEDDPATFGEEQPGFGDGTRCDVVQGDDAAEWWAALTEANQNTTWSDGGERRYSVIPRPLLPGEDLVCPELFGA